MLDRELMALAANAAGYTFEWGMQPLILAVPADLERPWRRWNPLDDDGDALRLSVNLALCVTHWPHQVPPHVMVGYSKGDDSGANLIQDYGPDPCAATRRAIVCAAAEMGRLK